MRNGLLCKRMVGREIHLVLEECAGQLVVIGPALSAEPFIKQNDLGELLTFQVQQ